MKTISEPGCAAHISDDDETWLLKEGSKNASDDDEVLIATQQLPPKKRRFASIKRDDEQTQPPPRRRRNAGPSSKKIPKSPSPTNTSSSDELELGLHSELTTVAGQLKRNPHFTEEEAKLAAKREYHRRNAARSRMRTKNAVAVLRKKCDTLSERAKELGRENEILRAKLDLHEKRQQQNHPVSTDGPVEDAQPALDRLPAAPLMQPMSGAGASSSQTQCGSRRIGNLFTSSGHVGLRPAIVPQLDAANASLSRQHLDYLLLRSALGQFPPS